MATMAALIAWSLPATAQGGGGGGGASKAGGGSVLKVGWASDPNTLNPFVAQDEEAFNIWSLNWDLLVNFSPEDLSPTPGIAESWDVSEDKKTVTFHLVEDANWSDGKPITSTDVKWSLEVLGGKGTLFTGYTDNVTSIQTPDEHTVVIKTKKPDARIVGGLFIYILPEHIWGKVPVKDLTGQFQPDLPLVGSGPYTVTEYDRGKITRMERNPEFRGDAPGFDELQFIKYGNQDAVERALQLGEIDLVLEVQAATFADLGDKPNIDTVQAPQPAYTQLSFNLCSEKNCPDAEFNPGVQDRTVRQAIAYAIDRERINAIAARGTSFVADGVLPTFYKTFYETPEQKYPYDPELANQMLDDAGWELNDDGVREKDGVTLDFDLAVRSESSYNVQAAKLVAEQAEEIGVKFNVDVVSTDKLYDLTVRFVHGKPAPDFDTFIWGWGGDPYDPSFLLSLFLTSQIGGNSDSFYSNPKYDRLFNEQAGAFDVDERKEIIDEMVAITQRDLPYIVLTYDPNLQAYRTDAIANGDQRVCPAETGDLYCEQTGYAGILTLEPAAGASGSDETEQSPGLAIIAAIVFGVGGWILGSRQARRREREPMELDA